MGIVLPTNTACTYPSVTISPLVAAVTQKRRFFLAYRTYATAQLSEIVPLLFMFGKVCVTMYVIFANKWDSLI